MKNWAVFFRFLLFIILLVIFFLWGDSQDWSFGKYRFVTGISSGPLIAKKGGFGLTSADFVRKVGGIAFGEEATPSHNIKDKKIGFTYKFDKKDGQRLELLIGGEIYSPLIYDWELIPIAKFADNYYDACVSLFGKESTIYAHDIVYHTAFNNTLLGLRLLQADIILINPKELKELPKRNGELVVGAGELCHSSGLWYLIDLDVSVVLSSIDFQSWVMVDDGEDIVFDASNGLFEITGSPYYYFWKQSSYDQIVEVSNLTNQLKQKREELRNLNPDVYNAAEKTMRYAAFFRFLKKYYPTDWNNFLRTIGDVNIEPSVKTPTKWYLRNGFNTPDQTEF
ncbi:MAG: hypothetical protein IT258_14810 [Saprospiraceae bacterium]|nr:hypothetical protein [Saprospiraceae bacterium]